MNPCCINCSADEPQVGTSNPKCASNGRCACHRQPSAEWEKEFDESFGTFPHMLSKIEAKHFIRKVVEQAREEAPNGIDLGRRWFEGFQAGRTAALKEMVEIADGMKKNAQGRDTPEFGYNTALFDVKQSITKLTEKV